MFCATDLNPKAMEGTAGEVRHYTRPMVGVVEVGGRYSSRFIMPRELFERGEVVAAVSGP